MKYLVVDSGPIIKGTKVESLGAETIVTVPEVLKEIRDRQARHVLETLPVEILTKEPSDEAIARGARRPPRRGVSGGQLTTRVSLVRGVVSAFARKTGDLAALSLVDTKVLALAWMLEKECNGARHLRSEPEVIRRRQRDEPKAGRSGAAAVALAPAAADHGRSGVPGRRIELVLLPSSSSRLAVVVAPRGGREGAVPETRAVPTPASFWRVLPGWATAARPSDDTRRSASQLPRPSEAAGPRPEDEDIPWITVDNLRDAQRADSKFGYVPDEATDVCCITTDFAMQNVIMRMGMRLLSAGGLVMKSVKQWAQQCTGCFRVVRDMSREFCAHCGNHTLVRVATIVDGRGMERILPIPDHVRAKILSTRGTRYTLPMPKSGRNAGNVITAEDQLAEVRERRGGSGGRCSSGPG